MIGLSLHLLALFVIAWIGSSLLVGLLRRALRGPLDALEPRARVRLTLAALALPLGVGVVVVLGVAVPHHWLGLVDHCLHHPGHLHLCLVHGAPTPHPAVAALAIVAGAWSLYRLTGSALAARRSAVALRRVVDGARVEGPLRVLPGDAPVAFTAGLIAAAVVVSEAVAADPARWSAVIEHEHAHARGRDPLVRWLAEALTAFHLPLLGRELVLRLREAQELAADERAATAIGCRIQVAETLIEWMRWSHATRDASVGFHSAPFAARVHRLLEPAAYRPGPSGRQLLLVAALLVASASMTALPLHHAVETVFGLLLS